MKQVIYAIAFIGGFLGVKHVMSPSLESQLASATETLNARAPFMLDSETRFDSASNDATSLTYSYTLVNVNSTDVDSGAVVDAVGPILKSEACANPDMKILFEHQVVVHYQFKGKLGRQIADYTLLPSDCGFS